MHWLETLSNVRIGMAEVASILSLGMILVCGLWHEYKWLFRAEKDVVAPPSGPSGVGVGVVVVVITSEQSHPLPRPHRCRIRGNGTKPGC